MSLLGAGLGGERARIANSRRPFSVANPHLFVNEEVPTTDNGSNVTDTDYGTSVSHRRLLGGDSSRKGVSGRAARPGMGGERWSARNPNRWRAYGVSWSVPSACMKRGCQQKSN